ncbi:MAG: DegT/DnrJ/EryC1/StrS family aminotransferase [Lachnospiraceae bacterium]|nr:DegT/DnrJ/EryC1/StrS family aminotransferase [Lachnospiraceae bacterium]
MADYLNDPRFKGIRPFAKKVWLASPTMHGDEYKWTGEAILTNWVSTYGENIIEVEKRLGEITGCRYVVGLGSGTAALHLAVRLAAHKLFGKPETARGSLVGHRVFCSDVTFNASTNPVVYENGDPVFIDSEYDTWNMDPEALDRAFELYPDVKLVVVAHLYGTPARMDEIRRIAHEHGAAVVEDAAESLGASLKIGSEWIQTGRLGDYGAISFNGNKIITGSAGGAFITDSQEDADIIRKWSTQSRDNAAWYQHSQTGYNYRMSNVIAGVIRGQMPYLFDHIEQKKRIYERYREGLADLPVKMNPINDGAAICNYWLSCMIIDEEAMCFFERGDFKQSWEKEKGKSCPGEILEALAAFNAEGRPIWKPMHMQPLYEKCAYVTKDDGNVGEDIFRRGLCLPSDIKMTEEEQDIIIDIIHRCFLD